MLMPMPATPPPNNSSLPDTPRTAMAKRNQFPPPAIDPLLIAIDEANRSLAQSSGPQPGEVRRRPIEDDGDDERGLFSPLPTNDISEPLALHPVRANLEVYARTLATSKRRKAEHTTQLVDFAKMSPEERQVWLADKMLAIDEKLEKEQTNAERSFTLSDATNAKKYVFTLLMSPLLPAYSLSADDIMKVLADRGVYPLAWNPYQLQVLQSTALDYATNKRCAIKDC
ncbi:hypothetical protein AURDEDRAFT_172939 [Auricularia subglabra TFB-10046 SS5]|nr:hypothetical protein AURDEDRAFT_172939 [Auricularia subglabra TFB-10046 SS5]